MSADWVIMYLSFTYKLRAAAQIGLFAAVLFLSLLVVGAFAPPRGERTNDQQLKSGVPSCRRL